MTVPNVSTLANKLLTGLLRAVLRFPTLRALRDFVVNIRTCPCEFVALPCSSRPHAIVLLALDKTSWAFYDAAMIESAQRFRIHV